jgi:hypothetical protein
MFSLIQAIGGSGRPVYVFPTTNVCCWNFASGLDPTCARLLLISPPEPPSKTFLQLRTALLDGAGLRLSVRRLSCCRKTPILCSTLGGPGWVRSRLYIYKIQKPRGMVLCPRKVPNEAFTSRLLLAVLLTLPSPVPAAGEEDSLNLLRLPIVHRLEISLYRASYIKVNPAGRILMRRRSPSGFRSQAAICARTVRQDQDYASPGSK